MTGSTLKGCIRAVTATRQPFTGPAEVVEIAHRNASYVTVTLIADCLAGRTDLLPADAIRIGLSAPVESSPPVLAGHAPAAPQRPAGTNAPISRAVTLREFDPGTGITSIDLFEHREGALMAWLASAAGGEVVTLSGARCEFALPEGVTDWLVVADPSALPAAAAILDALPEHCRADAVIGGVTGADRALLPSRDGIDVHWADCDDLPAAVSSLSLSRGVFSGAWVAGERGLVRTTRRAIVEHAGVRRENVHAAAYWVAGRSMTAIDAEAVERHERAVSRGLDPSDPDVAESIELPDD